MYQLNELEREFYLQALAGTLPPVGSTNTEVVVTQENYKTSLATIDPTKQYRIDGIIDMTADPITIVIPAGGFSFRGLNFDVSGIICSAAGFTLFQSDVGGSGNILGADCFIQVDGTGSQVWDVTDTNGFNAFEFSQLNYINCTSLGTISSYRQGLEVGTGRFGGTPELTLDGAWIGGYRFDITVAGNLSAGFTGSLFKAGATFSMNSRFACNMNINLPASASVLDFVPSNFVNPNTLLLAGMRVTRNGIINADDTNLTPNVSEEDLCSNWKDNVGLKNTYKGGRSTVTTEVETPLTLNTPTDLLGTYTAGDLVHFDSPANGHLRFISDSTREYRITYDLVVKSTANNNLRIYVVVDRAAGGTETVSEQFRIVNNNTGNRDVAFFNRSFGLTLKTNDVVRLRIENQTGSNAATAELDSFFLVEER